MKKLLALVLVLGMATSASAALQISVHKAGGGETWDPMNPQDSQINIIPSDTLLLDIWTDADIGVFAGHTWALVCDTTTADISGGVAVDLGAEVTNQINGNTEDAGAVIPPVGDEGIWGSIFNLSVSTPVGAGTVIATDILFHNVHFGGDGTISLYEVPDGVQMGPGDLMDSIVIHVPEPMSLSLLGLGGLGLLRRRRA